MAVLLLNQLKLTLGVGELNGMALVVNAPQATTSFIVFTTGNGQFDAEQFPLPAVAQALPIGVTVIETFCPATTPFTVKVVVPEGKVLVTGEPPFIEYV